MTAGQLRAVVCTSSLDLGVDWGGRPRGEGGRAEGASPMFQRIGRANHRLNEPRRAC